MTRQLYLNTFLTALTAMVLSLVVRGHVSAQEAPRTADAMAEMPVITISLMPQPEPVPPLKYSLIPAYADIQPGDAATSYYRAILMMPRDKELVFGDDQQQWLALPMEQFPREKARKWLQAYANTMKEMETATFREHCNWDQQVRSLTGLDALGFMLPELQETRVIARILRVRSRLEIAEGRYDDASKTLTMGYRLAANVAESPILISNLVGIAIANLMNESVIDWIDSGGPNLYWALASLPSPLVDIREALRQEMNFPLQIFPFLRDPESANYTPAQWREVIGDAMLQLSQASSRPLGGTTDLMAQTLATGMILAGYPTAKGQLIEEGMDPQRVEAMPVGQVVAIQSARACQKVYHESMKWTLLPYWQSHRQMRTSFQGLRDQGYLGSPGQIPGVLPIAALLLPAIESAVLAPIRTERDIAALQTIEAIRMSAANSAGTLPPALSDLQQFPARIDPVTGNQFMYHVQEGRAVLELPPPEGRSAEHYGKRYELRPTGSTPE